MNENQEESVLTFAKMFNFIKKALPIVLVTMMVLTIIGVVCVALTNDAQKTYSTQAVIELTYDGADNGLAPDGSIFDKNSIVSIDKIEKVLNDLGLSDKFSSTDIRNAFVITPRYSSNITELINSANEPDELIKLLDGLQPTSYAVTLSYPNVKNLSKDNALDIVSKLIAANTLEIANTLKKSFALPSGVADSSYLESYSNLEYVTIMSNYINIYRSTLTNIDGGVNIQSALVKLENLENTNTILNDFILREGLLTENDKTKSLNNLKKEQEVVSAKIKVIESNIKNINDTISKLIPTTGTEVGNLSSVAGSTGNIITMPDYSKILETLTNQLLKYFEQQSTLQVQAEQLVKRIDDITAVQAVASISAADQAKINAYKTNLYSGIVSVAQDLQNQAEGIATIYGIKTVLNPVNTESVTGGVRSMVLYVVIFLVAGFFLGLILYAVIDKFVKKRRIDKARVTLEAALETSAASEINPENTTVEIIETKDKE